MCVGKLTIIGSDNGLVAWTAPSHYLNQCWNIVNWTLRDKLQWNFNRNSNIFIQENALENIVCEMASMLSRPQWHPSVFIGHLSGKTPQWHWSRWFPDACLIKFRHTLPAKCLYFAIIWGRTGPWGHGKLTKLDRISERGHTQVWYWQHQFLACSNKWPLSEMSQQSKLRLDIAWSNDAKCMGLVWRHLSCWYPLTCDTGCRTNLPGTMLSSARVVKKCIPVRI